MSYLVLAVASALFLGVWKFGLSVYRGKVSMYAVILVSAAAAGVMYVVLGLLEQGLTLNREDVPKGLVGGLLNFAGTLCILKAFARGKVGIAVGVAALYILVPLTYSLYLGEHVTPRIGVGILLLLAGLATFYVPHMRDTGSPDRPNVRPTILLALGAALFWGLAIVVLDVGTLTSLTGTMATSQLPQLAIAGGVLVFAAGQSLHGVTRRVVAVLVGAGAALALGNIAFFYASNEGDIGVVSVIGAMSPMVTALLAAVFFKERLGRSDYVAFAIVLVGAGLVVA